jgi:hypothetical protein
MTPDDKGARRQLSPITVLLSRVLQYEFRPKAERNTTQIKTLGRKIRLKTKLLKKIMNKQWQNLRRNEAQ